MMTTQIICTLPSYSINRGPDLPQHCHSTKSHQSVRTQSTLLLLLLLYSYKSFPNFMSKHSWRQPPLVFRLKFFLPAQ